MKKNGFALPFSGFQILAWLTTFVLAAGFYALMLPVLEKETIILQAVLYSLLLIFTVIFGFLATFIDPTDDTVYQERKARECSEPFDTSNYSKVCRVCKTHVKLKSKHCGECDRCVENFDHHCKWLNNCIGEKNYAHFFILIIALELMVIDQLALGIYILVGFFRENYIANSVNRIYSLSDINSPAYAAVILTLCTLSLTVLIALAHLIALHIWLRFKKMTTYDYILYLRKKDQASVLPISSNSSESQVPATNYAAYIISSNEDPDAGRNRAQRQHMTVLQSTFPSMIGTIESKSNLLNQNQDSQQKECQSPSVSESLSFIIDVNESSTDELCSNKFSN